MSWLDIYPCGYYELKKNQKINLCKQNDNISEYELAKNKANNLYNIVQTNVEKYVNSNDNKLSTIIPLIFLISLFLIFYLKFKIKK